MNSGYTKKFVKSHLLADTKSWVTWNPWTFASSGIQLGIKWRERIIQNPWTAVVYVDFNLSAMQLDVTWNSAFKAAGLNNLDMIRKGGRKQFNA